MLSRLAGAAGLFACASVFWLQPDSSASQQPSADEAAVVHRRIERVRNERQLGAAVSMLAPHLEAPREPGPFCYDSTDARCAWAFAGAVALWKSHQLRSVDARRTLESLALQRDHATIDRACFDDPVQVAMLLHFAFRGSADPVVSARSSCPLDTLVAMRADRPDAPHWWVRDIERRRLTATVELIHRSHWRTASGGLGDVHYQRYELRQRQSVWWVTGGDSTSS